MELKVYHCNEWHNEYTEFYLKNEADKLIERKDKAFEYAQAVILVDIEIIKKQKRKRCLAMADKCLVLMMLCADKNQTDKSNFYKKWYITWSKLARQFKEAYIWKM